MMTFFMVLLDNISVLEIDRVQQQLSLMQYEKSLNSTQYYGQIHPPQAILINQFIVYAQATRKDTPMCRSSR